MTSVDMRGWASRNLWPLPSGQIAVRPGLRLEYSAVSNRTIVDAFSAADPLTGDVWFYIVDVDAGGNDCTIRVYDDDWTLLQAYNTGSDAKPEIVTHAVVLDQIIISSPAFPTVWGFVGGGLKQAEAQTSVNSFLTSLPVPRGICVAWASSRVVIADGASLYFSDPVTLTGGDPRTFVSFNQGGLQAPINGLHVGRGGMLVACTESGVWALSEQAAASGQIPLGDWQELTDYRCTRLKTTCTAHGRVFGLTRKGYRLIDVEGSEETVLDDPDGPLTIADQIHSADYGSDATIIGGPEGPIVSLPGIAASYRRDLSQSFGSWWEHASSDFAAVGSITHLDGCEVIVTADGAYRIWGDFDGGEDFTTTSSATGFFLGRVTSPVEGSRVIRRADVAADTHEDVVIECRGTSRAVSGSQPAPVIGTDTWSDSDGTSTEPPLESQRGHFSERTDDMFVAAGADRQLSRIDTELYLELKGPGRRRP